MTLRHGYFTGTGYTYRAYSEPSPDRLALLCLLRGHRAPDLGAPFRLLELGCGQGVQLCLQAANYPQASFLGIDFNPEHIAHARSLAAAAALDNVEFRLGDFVELEKDPESLGEPFHMVLAHGVLGWISPVVGAAMMGLSSAVLRPGGLLYLSHNTLPGWLPMLPFQHLIRTLQGSRGDGLPALEAARGLFSELREANAQLFAAQPGLDPRLQALAGMDQSYLLHEYNHSAWQPLYINEVIAAARDLNLAYLGTASLAENFDGLLPEPHRQLIRRQQDEALTELMRDLLTNQSFRRDVYIKGRDPLWSRESVLELDRLNLRRLLDPATLPQDHSFRFRLSFGEVDGSNEWFRALLECMGDEVISLGELRQLNPATPLPELLQNLCLLIGSNAIVMAPPERDPEPALRLNARIASLAAAGAPYRTLACPLSGNIFQLNDVDLLAVHALQSGCAEQDLVAALSESMQALDLNPMSEGQPLTGSERQKALQQLSEAFLRTTLPVLRRLRALP